jgi:hypothetical protein
MNRHPALSGARRAVLSSPGFPCIKGSESLRGIVTDAAILRNLHAGSFTAEAWVKMLPSANHQFIFNNGWGYGSVGWAFRYLNTGVLFVNIYTDGAGPQSGVTCSLAKWSHVAMTYDDTGDRQFRIWLNGELITTSVPATGATMDDTGVDLNILGTMTTYSITGFAGWCRISKTRLYTTTFTPPKRYPPPTPEFETVGLWRLDEMTGTTLDDKGSYNLDASLSGTYYWVKD